MPRALESGAALVTANARLARDLRREYEASRRDAGETLWESAAILPWEAWMEGWWRECVLAAPGPEPVLLSAAQEEVVWERIVEDSPQGREVLSARAAAAEAMRAYRIACAWELPLEDRHFAGFQDAAAFLDWARTFEREQERRGWLAATRLEREVAHRIEIGRLKVPARLLHAGFDEFSPAQQRLLGALGAAGCMVEEVAPPAAAAGIPTRMALRDAAGEIRAASAWARARLEQSPGASIGVVVPDLTARREAVERIFDDVLHPSLDMMRRTRGRAFHVSAGPVLSEVPVAAAALAILRLGRGELPIAEAGLLLRSPFVGGGRGERAGRALLDAELRHRGMTEVGLEAMVKLAGAPRPYGCPQLARRLRAWRRAGASLPLRQGASLWSRLFSRLLRLAGWPGDRTPDSAEYQAIERWNELLSDFAALDLVAEPMDYAAALARLAHMAAQARFAPADEGAPIQVMGMLEAAGARFDCLWLAGMEDRAWPAPPRPAAFLPPPLQRARGVPHCSAERELGWARRITARLVGSAPEVAVSYPLQEGDSDLRPSPLIAYLGEAAATGDRPEIARVLSGGFAALDRRPDHCGPLLEPGTLQRGGTGVLERQAACPFRAFAEYRLSARGLEEPGLGLSPQERGKVVHTALENIWREFASHAALVSATHEERAWVVARAVEDAMARQARGRGAESATRVQALECRRLERLLAAWLEVEEARAPFEVVASERRRPVELAGLALEIQVDRIDRLPDGRAVVIDYKTGPVSPAQWEGARPDAPQLPLYACKLDEPVAAVVFAHLAAGDSRFRGLQEDAGVPRADEYARSRAGRQGDTLRDHIDGWHRVLEALAREFTAGYAAVSPKNPQVCDRCDLPALCRIGELPKGVEDGPEAGHE